MSDVDPLHAALKQAVDILGSASAVARVVGVSPQGVSDLLRRGRKMPGEWCIPLELAIASKIEADGKGALLRKEQMRPDIYLYPDQRVSA